jgi:hypothetical protein
MSRPATSVFVFGIYLCALGVTLILAPNVLLGLAGFASTTEVWIRVLGAVVAVLGAYYVQAARYEVVPFFRMTIWGRLLVLVFFLLFALVRLAPPMLVLFGAVDGLGAFWTASALARARR